MGLDEQLVSAVLQDWRTAPVTPRLRGALAFVEALTLRPDTMSSADIAAARHAGLNDEALRELAGVVFCFSVMDRLADAFDFPIPTDTQVAASAKFLHTKGYKLLKLIR